MGKHETGYVRIERDLYPTPPWGIAALREHVNVAGKSIWESACGRGDMSEALIAAGAMVYSTDVTNYGYAKLDALLDFTAVTEPPKSFDGIITNPPFGLRGKLAERFVEVGLRHIRSGRLKFLVLLLPADFDSAKTRPHLFAACPEFAAKIVLTKRVVWFKRNDGKREAPKENSAWFLWTDDQLYSMPVIRYASGEATPTQWGFI